MRGFVLLLAVASLICAAIGLLGLFSTVPQMSHQPAIVIVPQITLNVLMIGLGLIVVVLAALGSLMLDECAKLLAAAEAIRISMAPKPPAPITTKKCPDCAEPVQAAARICRYCRHEFPAPEPASPKANVKPGRTCDRCGNRMAPAALVCDACYKLTRP